MIDPNTEELISIPEAAKSTPPRGVHVATCWRWTITGLADGRKLETILIGGRRFTSKQALARFLAPPAAASKPITAKERERRADAAEAELAAFGV